MPRVVSEKVTISFNRLVKDSDNPESVVTEEIRNTLEEVAEQLAAAQGVVVEIEKDQE